MSRRFLAVAVLVFLGVTPAAAGAPTDRLRVFFDRANRVLLAPEPEGGLEERVTAVRALVSEVFDVAGAAELALGRHWQALSAVERAAFVPLYADLTERAYLAWVGSKARMGEGGVSIRWGAESVAGETATVTSALLTRAGAEFPIEYRMVRRADGWAVRDVVLDGLSLAASYRAQFERVIQGGSYDELVVRLHERAGPAARAQALALAANAVRAMVAAPAPSGPPRVAVAAAPAPPALPAPALPAEPAAAVPTPPAAPKIAAAPIAATEPRESAPPVTVSVVTAPLAAAPPPAAVEAKTAAAPSREFWVQVGAFRSADAATRLVQRLRRRAVMLAVGGNRLESLTRVLVGPFAERATAASAVRELQASGIAAFIADTLR